MDDISPVEAPTQPAQAALNPVDGVLTPFMAIAAGLVGATIQGSPTDIHVWDFILKFALVAACVVAGRRAPWAAVGLAGLVTAVACYGAVGALISMFIVSLMVVGWRYSFISDPAAGGFARAAAPHSVWSMLMRSACCGTLACLALEAGWPHISLATSVMAATIFVLLLVPATAVAPPRVRRIVVRAAGLGALAMFLLAVLAGGALYEAKQPLQTGLSAAEAGIHAAERDDATATNNDFTRASHAFSSAQGDLAWARAAEFIPVVSQQVRAVTVAVNMGTSLATAGRTTATQADEGDLKVVKGVFPVAKLASLVPVFQNDLAVITRVLGESGPLSSPWLVGTLRSRFQTEDARIRRAQHDAQIALLASQVLPAFLGDGAPRTDLVMIENPAESRASGGVIGDYAEVTADDGKLHLDHVGSTADLNSQGVPPLQRKLPNMPDFVDRYSSFFPQDHWENIPRSPDFPTVGKVASYLFPQSGGVPVTGAVISIDPVAMAGLLKLAGGSIDWPGHPPITSSNIVQFLEHDEFVDFEGNNSGRIKFVEQLVKEVWTKLTSTSLPSPAKIARDMASSVKGHHLLMYSPVAGMERFFTDTNVAGAMPPVHGDFLGVVTQNGAGNKIDWYLSRQISYVAHLNLATDTISSTLNIALNNAAPSSGQPPYVIDAVKGLVTKPGESLIYLSVYSPWPLLSATVDGKTVQMQSQYELGRPVYSCLLSIPPGGTTRVTMQLGGQWKGPDHYELGMYNQPMITKDVVSTSVRVTG